MDIVLLRPATIPQVIVNFVKVVEIGLLRTATLPQVIVEVVYVGPVLPYTVPILITNDMLI